MAIIFEKYIEKPDTELGSMKFRVDPNSTDLPIPSPGKFAQLTVKDELGGTQWTLNYKYQNEQIHFTESSWAAFRNAKGIIVGDKIALYKDDEFGNGAQYRIEVTRDGYLDFMCS